MINSWDEDGYNSFTYNGEELVWSSFVARRLHLYCPGASSLRNRWFWKVECKKQRSTATVVVSWTTLACKLEC